MTLAAEPQRAIPTHRFFLDKNTPAVGLITQSMEDRPPTYRDNANQHMLPSPQAQLAAAYDTYVSGLYRYALMILADHSLAEDAVQQAFVKLAAQGNRISQITSRNGYLRTAVRNECYRILKRRDKAGGLDPETPAILEPVDKAAVDMERQREIERALGSLPADQREIVHMKVYEQMTFQQIADNLAISINTAASRYRYATEKLRRLLRPSYMMEGREND